MTIFQCDNTKCPNAGVEYNFETDLATAQCGGCGSTLGAK